LSLEAVTAAAEIVEEGRLRDSERSGFAGVDEDIAV
jgi:hypothetical protein